MIHDPLLLRVRTRRSETRVAAAIILVVALALLLAGDRWPEGRGVSYHRLPDASLMVPPRPDDVTTLLTNMPLAITPQDALAINAARVPDRARVTPARPFFLPPVATLSAGRPAVALECLTQAIYYEAAVESDSGQRAVAQVVLNRLRSPIFPHTVCGVVFQGSQLKTGCQFSFTCNGSLARRPSLTGWLRARRNALAALSGHVERSVGLATHYHADYVVPYWASSLDKTMTIGAHIFYTMRGGRGRPVGFGARYDPLAEAVPNVALAIDPLVDLTATGTADTTLPSVPRDRTVVAEDARGLALPAARDLPAPAATLRADERRGEIAADNTRGALNR